jgi:polygalacturonase
MTQRFTRRQALKTGAILIGGAAIASPFAVKGVEALLAPHGGAHVVDAAGPLPWPAANDILASTTVPTFPSATFTVTSFGAKGDGKTDNTSAFAKAIAACNTAGGGQVVVPAGTFVTGAIRLLSNVNLHLNSGATIAFSGDVSKYPIVLTRYQGIELMNHSPLVYAHGETNIAITGSGTLDAAGVKSWNQHDDGSAWSKLQDDANKGVAVSKRVFGNSGNMLRTTFVEPYSCTNVLIQGITLKHSWFWQLHPTLCTNVTVDGVTVTSPSQGNSDGCDPESCDHVVIKNSSFSCKDDTIAIKSGRDADGRRLHTPCQNLVIMNSKFESNRGMVAVGSEESGGAQNIYCFNLSSFGNGVWACAYLKANPQRGGFIKNFNMDMIKGTGRSDHSASSGEPAGILAILNYNGTTSGGFSPTFDQIHVNNMTFDSSPYAVRLEGLSGDKIGTVTVSNSTFTHIAHQSNLVSNVKSLSFSNVTINGKAAK